MAKGNWALITFMSRDNTIMTFVQIMVGYEVCLFDDILKVVETKIEYNFNTFISAMPLYWSSSCEELDRTPPTLGLQTRAVSTEAVSPCLPRPQHPTVVTVGLLPLVLLPLLHHLLHLLRGLYLLLLSCIITLMTILKMYRVYQLALLLVLRYSCHFFHFLYLTKWHSILIRNELCIKSSVL